VLSPAAGGEVRIDGVGRKKDGGGREVGVCNVGVERRGRAERVEVIEGGERRKRIVSKLTHS
jgi:hypothetical protein